MEPSSSQRPTIVVVGVAVVCIAAMFLLAQTWDSLGSIGSAVTQASYRRAVGGHEMSVEELTDLMRAVKMIAAAAAVVCAVFALSAVTGRRDSRIALACAAAVVAFAGLTVDPLLDAVLVFGAFLVVGSAPARAWYAGRTLSEPDQRAGEQAPPTPEPPRITMTQSVAPVVRPPAPPAPPSVEPSVRERHSQPTGPRPPALLAALGSLWLAIALGLVVIAGGLLAVIDDRAALVAWTRARFDLDPLTVSAMQAAALVTIGLAVIGFALLLLAILGMAVLRGGATARFLLLLAALTAAGIGFGVAAGAHLSSSASTGVLAASSVGVVSVVLLMTPSVSEYFGDRPPTTPAAPPPPPPAAPQVPDVSQPPSDEQRFPPVW